MNFVKKLFLLIRFVVPQETKKLLFIRPLFFVFGQHIQSHLNELLYY